MIAHFKKTCSLARQGILFVPQHQEWNFITTDG